MMGLKSDLGMSWIVKQGPFLPAFDPIENATLQYTVLLCYCFYSALAIFTLYARYLHSTLFLLSSLFSTVALLTL